MLVIVRPLLVIDPAAAAPALADGAMRPLLAAAFVVAAGGCSLLALANAPVGPTCVFAGAHRSCARRSTRGSTLVLAPA